MVLLKGGWDGTGPEDWTAEAPWMIFRSKCLTVTQLFWVDFHCHVFTTLLHRHGLYYLFFSTHAFDHAQYNVSWKSVSCNVELQAGESCYKLKPTREVHKTPNTRYRDWLGKVTPCDPANPILSTGASSIWDSISLDTFKISDILQIVNTT